MTMPLSHRVLPCIRSTPCLFKCLLVSVALTISTACKQESKSDDLGGSAVDKISNSAFEVVNVGIYNYTRNDIYAVYLLNPGSIDIDRSNPALGSLAAKDDVANWPGVALTTLAWDWRWHIPKHFNLVWLNVFDRQKFESAKDYNQYRSRDTAPGSAWCQLDITIETSPEKGKGNLFLLHFFPDGHVTTSRVDVFPLPVADFKNRADLPVLSGSPCVHTIPNPMFGKQEPKFIE